MSDIERFKQEICEIGDRLYKRGFAAANDGNITYRISENEVLCTPAMCCKGFLKPEEIALIDMDGKQLAGPRPRSSEALLHLEILRARPDVRSVVHCHPPHATAFAIAREAIPSCVLPEVEMFLGNVPIAPYETPGGQAFAETVRPFVDRANIIILANHGTVSYGETVERAYWRTEILDAYCRMLILAKQIGRVAYISPEQGRELLDLKQRWDIPDPRHAAQYTGSDLFADDVFRDSWQEIGVKFGAFGVPEWSRAARDIPLPTNNANEGLPRHWDEESLIERIAERVAQKLHNRTV
jgi:L-fuculose-phosphate aldolase